MGCLNLDDNKPISLLIYSLFFMSPVHKDAAVLLFHKCITVLKQPAMKRLFTFSSSEISLHISKDQQEISNTSTRTKSWIKHNERFVELNTFLSLKPFSKLSFAPSEDRPNEIPGSESKCHERILLLYKPPTTQASFIINCGSPSFFWKKMKIFAPLHWAETRRQGAD